MLLTAFAILLGGCVVGLILCDWRWKRTDAYRAAKSYPGGIMLPIIGNLVEVLFKNPVQTFEYARTSARRYGRSYRQWMFGVVVLNAIRVREVEKILSSTRHIQKSIIYKFLRPLLGNGLLNSSGRKWLQRRRILTPAFHFNILPKFLLIFQEESERLVHKLGEYADSGEPVVLQSIFTSFTLQTICETAMGVKLHAYKEADEYKRRVYEVGEMLVYRTMSPWLYDDRVHQLFGYDKTLNETLKPIHSFTRSIIRQRRESLLVDQITEDSATPDNLYYGSKQRYAMLDTLLKAELANAIDEDGIREEVDTFMFEGHDTTAAALIFTVLLLAVEQDAQERVFTEIRQLTDSKPAGDPFTMQDYNALAYLDRVVKESLRLYPPVAFISRNLSDELHIGDTTFPDSTITHIHIFDLHRDPVHFPDPERFDPDRFLPEVTKLRNPYAYVPFSAGPRNCIGQRFALLELKTALVSLLLHYRLLPVTRREDVVFVADLVLRAKNPIQVQLTRRL